MSKTAFITGISGQDGSYLAEFLLAKNYKVVGLYREDKLGTGNINHLKKDIILENGDLTDKNSLSEIIRKYRPDEIYNLAGITFVPLSWERPQVTFDVNTKGVLSLLEIIRNDFPKTRFYQASTAKIFGNPKDHPQNEKTPIDPKDPYAISKSASHFLVGSYRKQYDLFACAGILYNHESERRGEEFVTKKITLSAARIKLGLESRLALGNLEAKQDWGYAPDYVEAMWLMLAYEKPEDFVIATGELHSVKDVCMTAFDYLDLDWRKYVVKDPRFYRKEVTQALSGDSSKAGRILGWKPKTAFKQMIEKMVRYDYDFLRKSTS